jgi:hypothetical protein
MTQIRCAGSPKLRTPYRNQFFSEHFDASLRSLKPNGLAASDPTGLWNELRTYWP